MSAPPAGSSSAGSLPSVHVHGYNLATAAAAVAAEAQLKIAAAAKPIKRKRKEPPTGAEGSASAAAGADSPNAAAAASSSSASPVRPSFESYLVSLHPALHSTLQNELLALLYPDSKGHGAHVYRQLPGPQPASIVRRDLATLSAHEYWACEKSDGERAMLFISKERQAAYLVDRKFLIKQIKHPLYAELWAQTGDSVMDGELVVMESEAHGGGGHSAAAAAAAAGPPAAFMIFDLLLLQGTRFLEKKLSERLAAIGTGVVVPYRDRFPQFATAVSAAGFSGAVSAADRSDHPLAMRAKRFQSKQNLKAIFDFIKQQPGTDEYIYDDGKRKNKNDGIIFTPEADDYFCRNVPLMKWKWQGLNTIDFQVRSPWFDKDGRLMLYSTGNAAVEMEGARPQTVLVHMRSTQLSAESRRWFLSEVSGKDSAIVEMQYVSSSSSWAPKLFRFDKATPNFMSTVMATMETIIDNVTPNDLYQACGGKRQPAGGQQQHAPQQHRAAAASAPIPRAQAPPSFPASTSLPALTTSKTISAFEQIAAQKMSEPIETSRLFGD